MKQILALVCGLMLCTMFIPHDAFAKSFAIKLSESMNISADNKKPKDTETKKDTKQVKKETKKDAKKDKTKKTTKKMTKSKGTRLLKTKQN